jgi:Rieske Fe-S protein
VATGERSAGRPDASDGQTTAATEGRRRTLKGVAIALGSAAIGLAFAIPGVGHVVSPALTKREPQWVNVAKAEELPADVMAQVRYSVTRRDGWMTRNDERILYVRLGATPYVLSARCSHLGCNVKWVESENIFKCPCHAGVFDSDGKVVSGPPPHDMEQLDAEIRDGDVYALEV